MYFRHSTRLEAERLRLSGVARNLADGTVEVIAHGTPESVQHLREWLHRGPSGARVAAVQEFELPAQYPPPEHPPSAPLSDDRDARPARPFRVE